MSEMAWVVLTASTLVVLAALIGFIKNRMYITTCMDIIRDALHFNQDKLVSETSKLLVERVMPNVDTRLIERNIVQYVVKNYRNEIINAIAVAVADRVKFYNTEEEDADAQV